jgi:DNA-binding NarL/FixJ family response regulator
MMNSILVVDDHTLFREGLIGIMSHWEEFEICGEATNGAEALKMAHDLLPDIVLMDIDMPVMDGIEATRRISRELPSVRILMLTISEEEENLFKAIQCGADGYILKDTPSKWLREQIRGSVEGEAPLSGVMAAKIMKAFKGPDKDESSPREADPEPLSNREQDVLELLVQGMTNPEIAEQLVISENTVKKHIHNILEKFHLNNRVQAAMYAVREGLVNQ